jgi:hypothetical protein
VKGPTGRQIDLAIDYVLRLQQPNGLLAAGSDSSTVSLEAQFQVETVSAVPRRRRITIMQSAD